MRYELGKILSGITSFWTLLVLLAAKGIAYSFSFGLGIAWCFPFGFLYS